MTKMFIIMSYNYTVHVIYKIEFQNIRTTLRVLPDKISKGHQT